MNNDTEFSVQETLAGKKILLIGATGFLGRIMLYLLLKKVSGIAHLFLLIRATPGRDAQFRFAKEILESPVFTTVAGDDVFFTEDYLSQKVTVVEGDAAEENFSISDMSLYDRLLQETDIVINIGKRRF